jgi:GxxExxY protein
MRCLGEGGANVEMPTDDLTQRIIGCAYGIINTLGVGFIEKVYENALAHDLWKFGLRVAQQHRVSVVYDNTVMGSYTADLLVEDRVLVELKAVKALDRVHVAQCMNYLAATSLPVCLLLNFGQSQVEVRRLARRQ